MHGEAGGPTPDQLQAISAERQAGGNRMHPLFRVVSGECGQDYEAPEIFFLLYAAWVRSRAERPSVSYTKVVMEVAWTGHNLQFTKTN